MSEIVAPPKSHISPGLAATLSLGNDRLFLVALVLSVAPLWFGQYLPMVDLPQHAGQIVALEQMRQGNAAFTEIFEVNWFTPYLLGYLFLYVVSLALPVTVATKVVVSFAVLSIPLLTGSLLRNIGADHRWKWLAIPGGYSFAFYWGFLSYMVAVPFALLFLIQTFRFARNPTLTGGLLTAAFAIFLFFCHVIVLVFTSLVALGYIAGSSYKDIRGLVLRALPYTAPLPLIAVWLFVTHANESSVQNAPVVYGSVLERFVALLIQPAGLDSLSALSLIVTGSIALLPRLAGARFSRRPERWIPFAIGVVAFLAVPAFAFNTGFLYERLGIFLVPLWFMAWNPPSSESRKVDWVAMLIVVLWVFINTGRFAAFARETQYFDEIVAVMEPGRKVGSMIQDHTSPLFSTPVYLHFPAWYQAKYLGIVDFNFADFHPQLIRYKTHGDPRMGEHLAWYPTAFNWDAEGGQNYDYFIVKSNVDIAEYIFKEKRASTKLIARAGWWWLYQNMERQPRGK